MLGARLKTEKQTENLPTTNQTKQKTTALRLASWNVRTLCPKLNIGQCSVDSDRKTAVVDRELKRLGADIAALQETRLPDSGTLKESSYTFFWQGRPSGEPRQHGVGFAVRNSLSPAVEHLTLGNARLSTWKLYTSTAPVYLVSAYAPTLSASVDSKDRFYDELENVIRSVPATSSLYLLGDFNARVGVDHASWPMCLGHFGVGRQNENGQRLLELCSQHGLCVTNTPFSANPAIASHGSILGPTTDTN